MSLFKWYHSIIEFFHFARKHRIKVDPNYWYKGILLLLLGWGLLGLNSVIFKGSFGAVETTIDFIIQFFSATILIVVFRFLYTAFKYKKIEIVSFFKITHENEMSGSAIISLRERKSLIYTRSIIGVSGYIGFQLAKIAIGDIDNSIIYGADGLMYALMAIILLKEKYNWREWIGIIIAFLGIAILFQFDFMAENKTLAIWGGVLGISSSISLAIILILTSVIIQHDNPVRVAFYQCVCGFIISIGILFFSIDELFRYDFSIIHYRDAVIEGFFYASALICFFQAFNYVDPIIIAMSSYSLDIYVTVFEAVLNKEIVSIRNALNVLLIALGSAILIREEYKKEKHGK